MHSAFQRISSLLLIILIFSLFQGCGDRTAPISAAQNVPAEAQGEPKAQTGLSPAFKALIEANAEEISSYKQELPEDCKVLSCAVGDLDFDGQADLAVAVEQPLPDGSTKRWLCVLMKNKGKYTVDYANDRAVLSSDDGGVWGDPFRDLQINNGTLCVNEYGGSNFRWAYEDRFRFIANRFKLVSSRRISYFDGTGKGEQKVFDMLNNTFNLLSYSIDEDFEQKLIFSDELALFDIIFDEFDIKTNEPSVLYKTDFLPDLSGFEYDEYDTLKEVKVSADEAVCLVNKQMQLPMEKVQIPWTDETKANYSKLVSYQVPDHYFLKGEQKLCYFKLNDEGGHLEHMVLLSQGESQTLFSVDAATGKVKKL